ncbi:MAG: DUF1275 domain-containing protein [Streptococcaceae bacterium]|jgi:uncharacterized membrane protein YoaK (UPF0700 family)|nr:DUF1275 domain-containing protein [Streptococcaceae bacterium]
MIKLKDYRVYEGLRIAMSLTFIGGFLDAYSYKMLGGKFASMQSGNLIYFSLHLMDGKFHQALLYLPPVLSFLIGSIVCVVLRRFAKQRNLRWHMTAAAVELIGFMILALLSNHLSSEFLILSIAFLAAIQAESFKRLRGIPYATIMSTGNLKTFGSFLASGIIQRDRKTLEKARHSFLAILFFILGALSAALSTKFVQDYALFLVCLPLIFILILLVLEHLAQNEK